MNTTFAHFDLNTIRIPREAPTGFPGLTSPIAWLAEEGIYQNAPRVMDRVYDKATKVASLLNVASSIYSKNVTDWLKWAHVPYEALGGNGILVRQNALIGAVGLLLLDMLAKGEGSPEYIIQLHSTLIAIRHGQNNGAIFRPNEVSTSLGKPAWIVKDVIPYAA